MTWKVDRRRAWDVHIGRPDVKLNQLFVAFDIPIRRHVYGPYCETTTLKICMYTKRKRTDTILSTVMHINNRCIYSGSPRNFRVNSLISRPMFKRLMRTATRLLDR